MGIVTQTLSFCSSSIMLVYCLVLAVHPLSGQMRKRPCEMLLRVLFLPPAGWFAHYTRKKNLNANLANKVGFAQKDRKIIVDPVFGPNGALMSETDHASLSDMMSHIADCHEDHVVNYIRRLIPMLAEHMQATERQELVIQTTLWTNNNCESINNVLKSYTSCKPVKLPELVPILEEAANAQYRETRLG